MAAGQKISDYTPITGGIFDDTDLFDISEDIGSGLYQTRSITGAEIKASMAASTSLATADQTVNATGTRKIILGGSLVTDLLLTESAAGTDIWSVRGNNTMGTPTGYMGVGTLSVGTGFGGSRFVVNHANANTKAIQVTASGANGTGIDVTHSATSGSSYCVQANSTNSAGAVTKYGIRMNISGGGNNYAMQVQAGDVSFSNASGCKLGIATTEKIGLWNTTPIVQPTTAYTAATFAANTSGISDDTATWDSYTIGAVVGALRGIGILA